MPGAVITTIDSDEMNDIVDTEESYLNRNDTVLQQQITAVTGQTSALAYNALNRTFFVPGTGTIFVDSNWWNSFLVITGVMTLTVGNAPSATVAPFNTLTAPAWSGAGTTKAYPAGCMIWGCNLSGSSINLAFTSAGWNVSGISGSTNAIANNALFMLVYLGSNQFYGKIF